MFEALYDYLSFALSWRWPKAEGVITAVDMFEGQQLIVVYDFSLGEYGPYTGQSAMPSWFRGADLSVNESLRVGSEVTVRYRRGDRSVNRLDWSVWQNLRGL